MMCSAAALNSRIAWAHRDKLKGGDCAMPIVYVIRRILCDLLKQYPGEQRLIISNRVLVNQCSGGFGNPAVNADGKIMLTQTHTKN